MYLCPFGFPLGFSLFYHMYILLCSDRLSSQPDLESWYSCFWHSFVYIISCWFLLARYVIDRSVALWVAIFFVYPFFSTKAPSYNQSFILLYVLNFYFRGRNTLPSLNYDLSIRLRMVGCYIMVSEQFVPVEPEGWTDYASVHSLYVCYVLLVYLLDIVGINVHEHAFGISKH